ncbi:RHS repeat domain-containing protein [Cohnella hashimotonis]|uniref:RHS repeat-associated core domain-containing protein n=1 Tax=Cohnella hashimotonis TaxID=2826895 RepID=A0ABT6TRX3_9BACL|nr:RHS repeat-associated core domain-containing protein [Cohnella hashimotonis]
MKKKNRLSLILNLLLAASLAVVPIPPRAYASDSVDNSAILNGIETPKALYEMAANSPSSGVAEGEQISDVSGALKYGVTDFTLPGRNGLDVTVSRIYQSNAALVWTPKAVAESSSAGFDYDNQREATSYEERTWNLGVGWSFAFPSLEIRGTKLLAHLSDGTVYEVAAGGNGFVDHPLQDLTFAPSTETLTTNNAAGTSVSATAAYKMTDTLGTSVYFNSAGNWIGTKDAYGNVILVQYANQPILEGAASPLISKIIDTLNREITFAYTSNSVTVNYASGKQFVYRKTLISNEGKKRNLTSAENELGETTSYAYDKGNAEFDYDTTSGPSAEDTLYANLTQITYPTGSSSRYTYTPATKHLGSNGSIGYYRVASRYDQIKYDKMNLTTFDYTNNADFTDPAQTAYSTKRTMITNPNAASNVTPIEKISLTTSLNGQHLVTNTTLEKTGEYKSETGYAYDTTKELPTTVTQTSHDYTQTPAASGTETTSYTYDNYGNVLTATNAVGHVSTYTYDTQYRGLAKREQTTVSGILTDDIVHTIDSAKPQINATTQNYKDDTGQPASLQWNYLYDSYGNVTRVTQTLEAGKSQRTDIGYDAAYKNAYPTSIKQYVTSSTGTKTLEERYVYDLPTGRVTKHYDGNAVAAGAPAGSEESYAYDPVGRLTQITNKKVTGETAAGTRTYDFSYNTNQQQATLVSTDEEGKKTTEIYDGLGRLYKVQMEKINNNNSRVFYDLLTNFYNELGELAYNVDGAGHRTDYSYDAAGRQVSTTSGEGRILGQAFNDLLHQSTTTSDYGAAVTQTTDAIGRTTGTQIQGDIGTSPLTTSTSYEIGGDPFKSQTTDAMGGISSFKANGRHLLGGVTQAADPTAPTTTSYKYNQLGSLTEKVFPDLSSIVYNYDELGRRLSKKDSVQGTELYTYDDNSNLTGGTTRKGTTVTNTYDELNRLKSWASGAENGSYTYYKNGLRKSMTDETGTTQYFYRLDNQLEKVIYPDGKFIQYSYYDNGQVSSITDPFGKVINYEFNQDDQIKKVTVDGATQGEYVYRDNLTTTDPSYKKSSQLYQLKLAGGSLLETYTHDGYGRLTKLAQSGTGFSQDYDYTYDNNGNILTRDDGTTTGTFTYDGLNQILTNSEGSETYTYDAKGNRLTLESSIQNPTTDTIDYTYDDAEQLSTVTRNGDTVSYKYNGDGLMTERTQSVGGVSTTTRYYYDGANIIAEGTVSGSTVTFKARYVRGAQLLYRENAAGNKAYYLHNGHGDVTALRQANGTLLNEYSYDIWGNPLVSSETIDNPFGYAGEYWDELTTLQYLRARWYDPGLGRFISEDTYEGRVNSPQSLNAYVYVQNNPLVNVDPTGYWCSATVNGKYYSHPGQCSDDSNRYINDNNAFNYGRYIYNAGEYKGKWYPPHAVHLDWDQSGISDAFIGCAYDPICGGFVTEGISKIPSAYSATKTAVSKAWNASKKFFGAKGAGNTLKNLNGLDDILNDPSKLKGIKPKQLYKYLKDNGYNPTPLNKSRNYTGVPFEEGGGFKVNWGGDRILQYHPGSSYHGDVPYYKISSGSNGTQRFDMKGNLIK